MRCGWIVALAGALWGADAKLYLELGHSAAIESVAFSPDGRFVLTGSDDKTARLWDGATGVELRRFDGHSAMVKAVAFSPNGRFALTGSRDKTARLWDIATGAEVRRFAGHSDAIGPAAFSPDGRFVLTGSWDHTARLWDAATGAELRRFTGHSGWVGSLAFSPDGRFVLTGSWDETARLWDASSGAELLRLDGHSGDASSDRAARKSVLRTYDVTSVAFSPDGRLALTGSRDETARLWELASGRELRRFTGHSEFISAVAFSPDGRLALTAAAGRGFARLWDIASGAEIRRLGSDADWINSAVFSPDGRRVLTGSADKTARLWDAATGAELRQFKGDKGQTDWVTSARFSPDGRFVLIGGRGNGARLWDTATGAELRQFEGESRVKSVAFSPDGRFVLTGGTDRLVLLWDANSGAEVRRFFGHSGWLNSVAFSPDGRLALSASDDSTARLWDIASGAELRHFGVETRRTADRINRVLAAAFSPDGRFVLTAEEDHNARLWDASSGAELRRFQGHTLAVNSVAFSPDGRFLLTASFDNTARLWNTATGVEVRRFAGHSDPVNSATFSPDGRFVLTGSEDNTARLWDARTGAELRRLVGHSSLVDSVAFSPDGRLALTGSWDGTTRLWDTASGRPLATLISFGDRGWATVDPDGRFDTGDLDGHAPLHWTIPDEPFRPLPLEIFMRDYYTPRLGPRILKGEALPAIAAIGDIRNRVQPDVEIVKFEAPPGSSNRVSVTVRAAGKTEKGQSSGLQDLRLFRNGQMVGYREGRLKDGAYTFQNIQLPAAQNKAVFTAYAFNSARIKSATVERDFEYVPAIKPEPKAYLVEIGVNHYQANGCELRYAVNDAHKLHTALEARLKARGLETHAVELVSTRAESTASHAGIRDALAGIASKATPDDVFFLSFSGHGYTTPGGLFYLLPADIQGSCGDPDGALLKRAISADELAEWLRPIDAGEMTFILDACYSAASVEANGFKPGPMGSRGLGQLAYDKRMRILAASQSDAQALEDARFGQGLLSYALTEEGLAQGKADWRPKDKQITLGEWLAFAADAVPKLNAPKSADGPGRGVSVPHSVADAIRQAQVPAVFDFSKQDGFVIQK